MKEHPSYTWSSDMVELPYRYGKTWEAVFDLEHGDITLA